LKYELVWRIVAQTQAKAKEAVARCIDGFYNPIRRCSKLGNVSPVQFARLAMM
jgi:putative transposase